MLFELVDRALRLRGGFFVEDEDELALLDEDDELESLLAPDEVEDESFFSVLR